MSSPPDSNDKTPSILARYTTASIFAGALSAWAYHAYPSRGETPGLSIPMHGPSVPMCLTALYLVSLPLLRVASERCLAPRYDMKLLLTESMILYNVVQVGLNGWMVYAMVDAVINRGHPFIGSRGLSGIAVNSGASYAVWVHYCDKYLEFLDTYFMILRGKMDQVSVLGRVGVGCRAVAASPGAPRTGTCAPTCFFVVEAIPPPRRWQRA
jgi:elongation of very long chain fatty acids protein 4